MTTVFTPVTNNEKYYSPYNAGRNAYTESMQFSHNNSNSFMFHNTQQKSDINQNNGYTLQNEEQQLIQSQRLNQILQGLGQEHTSRTSLAQRPSIGSEMQSQSSKCEKVSVSAATQTMTPQPIQIVEEPQQFMTPRPLFLKSSVLS